MNTNWEPSEHEIEISKYLFNIADVERVGQLSGKNAVAFLTKSKLDRGYLRQIWELSDTLKQHYLGLKEFQIAMRLVLLAQNGYLPSPTILHETKDLNLSPKDPIFDGVPPFVKPEIANIDNINNNGLDTNNKFEEPAVNNDKSQVNVNNTNEMKKNNVAISMPEVLMDEGNNNNNNNKVDDDALDPFASLTSAVEDAPLPALSLYQSVIITPPE